MLFEYFKSNNSITALPTTTTTTRRSHLITFKKCPALNQYNKRCGCFCFYNHTSCFVAKRKPTTKQCCLYGLALRRKIRKTSRRKRKYRRRHHAIVVINNNRHYNNNDDDDDDDVDVNNNNKTKEKKIDNETVKSNNTNCVNIVTTTATTTTATTTTTSSIKCKQNVNNTKRKTLSCSLKTKKKTIKQCHNNSKNKVGMCECRIANIKSISSTSCSCKNNTNCNNKSCCNSSGGSVGSAKNNCCSCKMNLIVKNLVTLLLPKITLATQTTQTTIITSKLAHTIPAAPKETIKCLRECCTMAAATPTAATSRLLTVQNNVRENISKNAATTTRTTTTETKNVQLHATKENLRQQQQHQHQHQHQLKYLNALGKCVKIVTKQQQQHVNKTSSSSSTTTLPLYQKQQTTAKIQTSFPTFTKNKTKISTPSSSSSSALLSSSSSPAAAAPLLPSSSFSSSSSCTWYGHNNSSSSSSRNTSTSSRLARLIAPTRLLNELYGIIFMTLLVLSICHNNVLETSAASVKISRREILAAPASVSASASVSVSASTARVVKQAIMPSGEAESPFNQRQHSPEQISPAKAQSYFSQDEQPHQPLEQDKRRETVDERAMEAEMEMETDNSNNIFQPQIQPQYLPTYQQHYQQHHYQEEQMQQKQQQQHHLTTMATTTTTTSFSHGMALETTYNHTFQSLSIIDGDLAVAVVDTSHQNLMTVEEEMLMAAAGGAPGVGSSSLSLDDFHLHDNVLSSYDATSMGLDGAAGIEFTHHHAVANSMPIFDFGMPRNITARTGHTEAVIKCRVDRLDDKSVSWIRKRDLHILTVGTATYTSDKRFQVTESKDSREWTLHVKSPQARDSGIYECQVNTEPKMSMAFQLNVIEISPDAKAVITGPADLHFKVGSAIILTCIVHQPSVKDIGPIYWYRGEYMITPFDINDNNHDESAGAGIDDTVTQNKVNVLEQNQHLHTHTHHQHNAGIYGGGTGANVGGGSGSSTTATDAEQQPQILTNEITQDFAQRIAMESQLGDTMKSRLRISNAQTSDTGNYTCQPTTASSASVMVHVINDENPAAMQKSGASSNNNKRQENMMPLLSATLVLTIASAMASLLNMAAPVRVRAPAIRMSGNEWWLSTAITTALLAKTIPTMRFTIEIIKSYIMAMLSYHLHCDVISMLHGIDLIQQQQQQAQLIVVMLLQSRQHELWWNYYSKRPCYRIHNNILRNSYANNNNNNNGKYFMQNGCCLCIIVVIRGYLVSHPAYDIISYNTITVTDTVTDTDSDNDTATDTTLTALCYVAQDLCRISVEPAYESLRGLQYASNQH